jgi:hypothetical protein
MAEPRDRFRRRAARPGRLHANTDARFRRLGATLASDAWEKAESSARAIGTASGTASNRRRRMTQPFGCIAM